MHAEHELEELEHGGHDLDPTLDFIAGTISGIAGLSVGYPFDTVKVRFQSTEFARTYTSTAHALSTIVREERFIGLYKGIMSPVTMTAVMNGLVFSSYRLFMKLQLETPQATPTLAQVGIAGAGSGIISAVVTTPTELVKIYQQSFLERTSTVSVAVDIFRENGVRGLYRGLSATAWRDIGYGAYFCAYEATCRWTTGHGMSPSWPQLLLAGGVAGIAGWVFTFPFDVIKTRMQTPPTSPSQRQLTLWSTTVASYRAEGISVFFRGLSPTLIRAIPVNMATFGTFELILHWFGQR